MKQCQTIMTTNVFVYQAKHGILQYNTIQYNTVRYDMI